METIIGICIIMFILSLIISYYNGTHGGDF
jgi:hypothetical protein